MNPWTIFWSLSLIGMLLVMARLIKSRLHIFTAWFIPSSIIAGLIALLASPYVAGGLLAPWLDPDHRFVDGLIPENVRTVWGVIPGLLINVVFAALFLGKTLPGPRKIWMQAGPQVVFGQTLAWGQYVVGIGLCVAFLTPVFGLNPLAGALIEIGFEGGHGTAAGMAEVFRSLDFPDGADLALGLATVGLVAGVALGTVLINWAVRKGHINPARRPDASTTDGTLDADAMVEFQRQQVEENRPTDPLSIHLGIVAIAVGVGWVIRAVFQWTEALFWDGDIFGKVPLFPLAMIGGVLIQVFLDRTGNGHHIDRRLMNRISGTALDFTIVAALGTLRLDVIGAHLIPFLLLALAGIAWNTWGLLWLAPRVIPSGWFERGIGDYGQSMGVTVTGLLLMRVADPANESGALDSFGYKQLLFEPIVGGGLFTAASVPLLARFGSVPMLVMTGLITVGWIVAGFLVFGRGIRASQSALKTM